MLIATRTPPPLTLFLENTYGRHSRHAKDLGSASQPSGHFTHGVDVVLGTFPASQKRQVTDGSSFRSWYLPRIQSRQFFVVLWKAVPAWQNLQVTGNSVLFLWSWYLPLWQPEQNVVALIISVPGRQKRQSCCSSCSFASVAGSTRYWPTGQFLHVLVVLPWFWSWYLPPRQIIHRVVALV